MAEDSPFDALVDAFRDAKKQMVESTRSIRADVVRPLDPNAREMGLSERQADFNDFLLNPARRESEFLQLQERFRLPTDRPIPRRLVDYIIQGMREARSE